MKENSAEIITRILSNDMAHLNAKPKNYLVTIYVCSLNFPRKLVEDRVKEITHGGP